MQGFQWIIIVGVQRKVLSCCEFQRFNHLYQGHDYLDYLISAGGERAYLDDMLGAG